MLGIIIAMPTECTNLLKNYFVNVSTHIINGQKFYVIETLSGECAVLAFSGIGKVNAATITTIMINSFKIDSCFNIGSAGILEGYEIGEILLIDQCLYGDVDATMFGYEINQIPKMPSSYNTDSFLNEILYNILVVSNYKFKLGHCYTNDSFINTKNINRYNLTVLKTPCAIDMECCAIAQVCHLLKVSFCALKIGIDKVYDAITNEQQFNENLNNTAHMIDLIASSCIEAITFKSKKSLKGE